MWHHGLAARWWAEFNRGGEDVDFLRRALESSGEPALDLACGTGRVLLPLRAAGPERGWRRTCADGSELELSQRVVAFDPLRLTVTRELRIEHWIEGELAAAEERPLTLCIYFVPELEGLLRAAGFGNVRVTGGLGDGEARPWEDRRVFFHALA